jgi:thiosulfate oxidation carrier complex protein SoxZ
MSTLKTPRVRLPRAVRAGEAFEVRLLMEHPMETGLRQDGGRAVPRDMLRGLTVTRDGETIFEAVFRNGTAANPFHVLHLRLDRTAELAFTWTDERGQTARFSQRVTVA